MTHVGRRVPSIVHFVFVAILALYGCASTPSKPAPQTPAQLYGELFEAVQMGRVFADSKTFVDATAKRDPREIVAAYQGERGSPSFDLAAFVAREFSVVVPAASDYHTESTADVRTHIDSLWSVLTRDPAVEVEYSSRLALPERYVVPGGRFNEMYYWDSYFTMLGLEASGRHDLVRAMCDNFASLIERYGHIPNGTRSYYLSRSQPPFFAAMVELLALHDGTSVYAKYRPALQREYDFWMSGSDTLERGQAHRRVVRLQDGTLLNRYWDDQATPREESYREDVATAAAASRPKEEVYRNLRAAAESGWDFSSRWFADGRTLQSIRTVELIPPDLNSLIYALEQTLSRAYEASDASRAQEFKSRAATRRAAVQRYLWDPAEAAFTDYSWAEGRTSGQVTAATAVPLYFGLATDEQARAVARTIESKLLGKHGVVTTPNVTGQQWDAPNGWAPLQWMAIEGLQRYGNSPLADEITRRWIEQNLAVFKATGKLVEKYDVMSGAGEAGGGEYPLQDGFGWTNGVLRALMKKYPQAANR